MKGKEDIVWWHDDMKVEFFIILNFLKQIFKNSQNFYF